MKAESISRSFRTLVGDEAHSSTKKPATSSSSDSFQPNKEKKEPAFEALPEGLREIANVNHGTHVSMSGLQQFESAIEFFPQNEQQVLDVMQFVYDTHTRTEGPRPQLVVGAGTHKNVHGTAQGLSMGGHAQGRPGDLFLNTLNLQSKSLGPKDFVIDSINNTITVVVKAGTSWKDTLNLANSTFSEADKSKYEYLPFCAPTSQKISVAGSLASQSHSRTSGFAGGYMPQSVEQFGLATIQDGKAKQLQVSHKTSSELFNAIAGSFGRGGVITDVSIRLQRVPRNCRVVTSITRYDSLGDLSKDWQRFADDFAKSKDSLPAHARPFHSAYVTKTKKYFYLYKSELKSRREAKKYRYFRFFESPTPLTSLLQIFAHEHPSTSRKMIDAFTPRNAVSKNHSRPWIFIQDSFVRSLKTFRDMKTIQHAYVFPLSDLERFHEAIDGVQKECRRDFDLKPKMEDFVLLPPSETLMAPAHDEKTEKTSEQPRFVAYTVTWPILNENHVKGIAALGERLSQMWSEGELEELRIHPVKNFGAFSAMLGAAHKKPNDELEKILNKYGICDALLWNQVTGVIAGRAHGS